MLLKVLLVTGVVSPKGGGWLASLVACTGGLNMWLCLLRTSLGYQTQSRMPMRRLYPRCRFDRPLRSGALRTSTGQQILVTGASGGVGYFACQLGKLMGAEVVAYLRRGNFESMVRATNIKDVVISVDGTGLEAQGRFRAIIDGVGGHVLSKLLPQLDEGGRAILYGVSAGPEATLAIRDLFLTGDGRVEGFHLYRETEIESAAKGLDRLLCLLADKRLMTHVPITEHWKNVGEMATQLVGRDFPGKAVLTI